jgi:D-alanine-D-alanine ligase
VIIGFTYDLKDDYREAGFSEEAAAEFDERETIEGIEGALVSLGHEVVRIGSLKALAARLVAGERWDLVFNIAEGVQGVAREAQVPALLDAYEVPYVFSDPMVLGLCLHKGLTKHVVRDAGVPTARFHVVERASEIQGVDLVYPLFVKPVMEGTGKGIGPASRVQDVSSLRERCRELLAAHRQPVLVEEYLPGREFTVGILGTGADAREVGVMEVRFKSGGQEGVYGLQSKKHYHACVEYALAEPDMHRACAEVALKAWRVLACRDGGRVDLRCDGAGLPHFLEVNPLAGLHPVDSDLPILARMQGMDYRTLLAGILGSALRRVVSPFEG